MMVKHSRSMMMMKVVVVGITLLLPLLLALMAMVITTSAANVPVALKADDDEKIPESIKKCNATVINKIDYCSLKYTPMMAENPCKAVYSGFSCYVYTICSKCEPDDAIATEKFFREGTKIFLETSSSSKACHNYKPPKSLDKPFCTPSSGIPVWAIIIIVLVVLGCCCGVIGIAVYCFCFASDNDHPNRSGSGHSGKQSAAHHGGKGGKHSSKTGKRHSSKGRHSSSHQSHN